MIKKAVTISLIIILIASNLFCFNTSSEKITNIAEEIYDSTFIKTIKSELNLNFLDYDLEGGYSFFPCDSINIEGEGTYYNQTIEVPLGEIKVLVYHLNNGIAKINDFSREYNENEITAFGFFISFEGNLSEDPLKINGNAFWGCLVEHSSLVEFEIIKNVYKKRQTVTVYTKNIADKTIEIKKPNFYIIDNDTTDLIYHQEEINNWVLQPGEQVSWQWNQKNNDGQQVKIGNYSVIGQFSIINRVHAPVEYFRIEKKFKSRYFLINLLDLFQSFYFAKLLIFNNFY